MTDYDHFVVTGSGRSGTRYMREVFTHSGLPCAHQTVYHHDCDLPGFEPEWGEHFGDSSAFAAACVLDLSRTIVIHQTRDPRRVIPSLIENRHVLGMETNAGTRFIERYMPELVEIVDLKERAAAQWVGWNHLVERASDRTYYVRWKLEELSVERLRWLWEQLGQPFDEARARKALHTQPKDTGTRGRTSPIDLLSVRNQEFHEMAKRYGYGQ